MSALTAHEIHGEIHRIQLVGGGVAPPSSFRHRRAFASGTHASSRSLRNATRTGSSLQSCNIQVSIIFQWRNVLCAKAQVKTPRHELFVTTTMTVTKK